MKEKISNKKLFKIIEDKKHEGYGFNYVVIWLKIKFKLHTSQIVPVINKVYFNATGSN